MFRVAQAAPALEYIVLSHLAREPAGSQLALAEAIGYDKTRLIGVLGALERADLITRTPGAADRRARIVELTAKGRRRHTAAQADIHAMEDDLLAPLSESDRRALHRVLRQLS